MSKIAGQRRRDHNLGRVADHHLLVQTQEARRVVVAGLLALQAYGTSDPFGSVPSGRASNEQISSRGSNSKLKGMCGSSICQVSVRPRVRTLVWRARRWGPLASKSAGTMVKSRRPAPAVQAEYSSSPARRRR